MIEPAQTEKDPLLALLWAVQMQHQLFPAPALRPTVVVVAVSGGADSVCLLHALSVMASSWHLHLHVAHIDHGLRPDSGVDAALVEKYAATLSLPLHKIMLEPAELHASPDGLEAAARRARYNFLSAVATNMTPTGQIPIVAVAHHADDQAETVLLHLLQGSGLRGLGGMRPVSELRVAGEAKHDAVQLVRPFLHVRRSEILAYLRRHELVWREDATNQDTRLVRNYLRHNLLPSLIFFNPMLVETLGRTAAILAAEAERSEQLDQNLLHDLATEPISPERVVLDLARWSKLPLAARRGVLRLALLTLDTDGRKPGYEHVEELVRCLHAVHSSSGPHSIVDDIVWTVTGPAALQPTRFSLHRVTSLPFVPEHPLFDAAWRAAVGSCAVPVDADTSAGSWVLRARTCAMSDLGDGWRSDQDPWRAFLDADRVGDLCLATPVAGFVLAPLGMARPSQSVGRPLYRPKDSTRTPRGLAAACKFCCATGIMGVWPPNCSRCPHHASRTRPG